MSTNPAGGLKWTVDTIAYVAKKAAELGEQDKEAHPGALLMRAQRICLPKGPWLSDTYCMNTTVWSKPLKTAFDHYGLRQRIRSRGPNALPRVPLGGVLLKDATLEQILLRQQELLNQARRRKA